MVFELSFFFGVYDGFSRPSKIRHADGFTPAKFLIPVGGSCGGLNLLLRDGTSIVVLFMKRLGDRAGRSENRLILWKSGGQRSYWCGWILSGEVGRGGLANLW